MKIKFDHRYSKFIDGFPLLYVEAEIEDETPKQMFETGWVPLTDKVWYQTRSARLKLNDISSKRKKELNKISITNSKSITCFPLLSSSEDVKKYSNGKYLDFCFDDKFAGRINLYEDQVFYSMMSVSKDKKSYGTLSYYYLIDKLKYDFKYLYISDYFDIFKSKSLLPGFEYWNGSNWILLNKEEL